MCISKDILIQSNVYGTLTTPAKNGCFPAVLLFPGFASHKDEIANIYVLISSMLARNGIASLRFDYPCCGKSPGDQKSFNLTTALEGSIKAAHFLETNDLIDKNKIGFCGFSMGAAIAILLTQKIPNLCNALLMLSPAKCLLKDFTGALGENVIQRGFALKENETVAFNYPVDGKLTELKYSKSFFTSLTEFDVDKAAQLYKGAFFVIAGQNDFSHKNAKDYMELIPSLQKQMLSLPETDHILNVFGTNSKLEIAMVTNFFTT